MKFSFKFETNVPPRNHFGQKHDLAFDNSIDELLVKSIYIDIKLNINSKSYSQIITLSRKEREIGVIMQVIEIQAMGRSEASNPLEATTKV